jgi:hypothetical protein
MTLLKMLRAEAPRPVPPPEGQTGSIGEAQATDDAGPQAPSGAPPAKAVEGQPAGAAQPAEGGAGQTPDTGQN